MVHCSAFCLRTLMTSKGGGDKDFVKKLLVSLEKAFGKIKCQYKVFEHCGVMHTQHVDGSVDLYNVNVPLGKLVRRANLLAHES